MKERIRKIKEHIEDNMEIYISGGMTIILAGITVLIVRDVKSQYISPGIAGTASRGIAVTGKSVVMNNVSFISSNRQGPPSWVVRCLETGAIFASQHAASIAMNLVESDLSQQLNGHKEHVGGYHFERICMAA